MPQHNHSVILEDVRIIFRNFSGREGMYNQEGDRNFAVELPRDVAEQMAADGWNVKVRLPREEGDEEQPYISVAVEYRKGRPPTIKMISSQTKRSTILDADTVSVLDMVDIAQADLIINPQEWSVGGRSGVKAYLKDLYITIIENPLELKYGSLDLSIATVDGPMMEKTEPLRVESTRGNGRREIER